MRNCFILVTNCECAEVQIPFPCTNKMSWNYLKRKKKNKLLLLQGLSRSKCACAHFLYCYFNYQNVLTFVTCQNNNLNKPHKIKNRVVKCLLFHCILCTALIIVFPVQQSYYSDQSVMKNSIVKSHHRIAAQVSYDSSINCKSMNLNKGEIDFFVVVKFSLLVGLCSKERSFVFRCYNEATPTLCRLNEYTIILND